MVLFQDSLKKITPDYIVGFTDGEGCFTLHITKKQTNQFGICLTPSFSVSQNTTSCWVLLEFQNFFQCGFVRTDQKTSKYEVRELTSLQQKIIPFFQQHPLRTLKNQYFRVFCEICDLFDEKAHLQYSGVYTLVNLAYSMNQSGVYRRKTKAQVLSELEKYKPTNLR